jgi:hypothetical protein
MTNAIRLTILALLTAVLGAVAAPAHAAQTGSKAELLCGAGQVKAMAPAVYTNQNETVFWTARVAKWNGATFEPVTAFAPFAYAGSVNGRTGAWFDLNNRYQLTYRDFSNLGNGYFAVETYFYTQSGGWTARYASYGNQVWCAA